MRRFCYLPPLLILIAIVMAVGCATKSPSPPGGGVSLSRDEWGHRPGPRGFRTVIIDAGHGGIDSGAISRSGLREKDLALDTARRLRSELSRDFKVVMVRDNDRFVDLDDRVAFANRHDSAILRQPALQLQRQQFQWSRNLLVARRQLQFGQANLP